jgi:alpha-beta hydrolase superfamily lysophospholipase
MIAMRTVLSTSPFPALPRRAALLLSLLGLGACATHLVPPGPSVTAPRQEADAFIMADGTRLPYRAWVPERVEPPWAVVLALHGMNDSRDAFEDSGPDFAEAGILVIAPDQRGFGDTAQRGYWPGAQALADDAGAMARALRAKYPRAKLVLMGESMGAGVLMLAATGPSPPPADGYVLLAPAIWGRAEMNVFARSGLWLLSGLVPGLTVSGRIAGRVASDNRDALIRLSRNRLTIKETRVDAIKGVVDLMDASRAAAARFHGPALVLHGGEDQIIPPDALRDVWRKLPPGTPIRLAHYPKGYHLLLRDKDRERRIADILTWIRRPNAPLPSTAETDGKAFLARAQ